MNLKSVLAARKNQKLPEALGDLFIRASAGLSLALAHGINKFPPPEPLVAGIERLGFPAPSLFAWCAFATEFLGGLLLAAGLFTRPAAAAVAFMMSVAAFGVHAADPFAKKELALMYLAVAIYALLSGPGKFSADALFNAAPKRNARPAT